MLRVNVKLKDILHDYVYVCTNILDSIQHRKKQQSEKNASFTFSI